MHLLLLAALLAGVRENCVVCHSDVKVQFSTSVHAKEDIQCTGCHGGDPAAETEKSAHTGTFKPLNDRKQLPQECARCHSDSARMKPYGLPTDQLALYATSVHGKKLAAGDTAVAVCTDCHGVHKILPPLDPESQTHPRNIPGTCGSCHADARLMENYKISASVVSEYQASVHAKALEEGNQQAPVCTSCHGTHGAAPPGVGDVSIVCGHCHAPERDNFRLSPHKTVLAEAGIPECAGCHSNHKILKTNFRLWSTSCSECHSPNSVESKRGQQISQYLKEADAQIRGADAALQHAIEIPLDVSDYQARLEEARTYLVQVLPISHSLNVSEVEDLTRRTRSVATEIRNEIGEKEKILNTRRYVLVLVWFYILLTIVIIYRFRKYLESRTSDGN